MSKQRYILIPHKVSSDILTARGDRLPHETGGFLIGHRRGDHLEILSCTHQAPGDVATPTSFSRLSKRHAEEIEAAWSASEGRQSVIGDWHSHPSGPALPSAVDKRAWKSLAKAMKASGIGIIAADGETRLYYFALQWGQLQVADCPLEEAGIEEAVYAVRA